MMANLTRGLEWPLTAVICTAFLWYDNPAQIMVLLWLFTKMSFGVFFGHLVSLRYFTRPSGPDALQNQPAMINYQNRKAMLIIGMVIALQLAP